VIPRAVLAVPADAQSLELKLTLTTLEEAIETPVAGWVSIRSAEQGDGQGRVFRVFSNRLVSWYSGCQ